MNQTQILPVNVTSCASNSVAISFILVYKLQSSCFLALAIGISICFPSVSVVVSCSPNRTISLSVLNFQRKKPIIISLCSKRILKNPFNLQSSSETMSCSKNVPSCYQRSTYFFRQFLIKKTANGKICFMKSVCVQIYHKRKMHHIQFVHPTEPTKAKHLIW